MIRSRWLIAAGILSLSLSSAHGQPAGSPGSETCATFAARYGSEDGAPAKSWIIGYMDGVSQFVDNQMRMKGLPRPEVLAGLQDGMVVALVHEFCRGHADKTVADAATEVGAQLIAEDRLQRRRDRTAPSPKAETIHVQPERHRAETTGQAVETTGSIGRAGVIAIHGCERITVDGPVVHQLRKCD